MRRLALSAVLTCAACAAWLPLACSSSSSSGAGDDAGAGEASPDTDVPPVDASSGVHCDSDLATDGVFGHLQCAGLYSDIAAKTIAGGLRPYTPALVLWADGAEKHRWLSLPQGQKIDTSNFDEWVFPNGTKVWKEFQLDGKRIETRLYAKGTDGTWRHTSYVWNDAETDAVRSDEGRSIARPNGAPPYQVPTANECNSCHGGRKDHLLGLEAVNLGMPGTQGITLASLVAEQLLTTTPPATTLAFPEDATGKAAAALGWLHVSCGPCHNRMSGASAQNSMVRLLTYPSDLTGADAGADGGPLPVSMLDAYTTTVDKATSIEIPDGGGATFSIVKRGDPAASIASYLSGRRVAPPGQPNEKEQMPPIVTRIVDTAGHQLFDDWITALP